MVKKFKNTFGITKQSKGFFSIEMVVVLVVALAVLAAAAGRIGQLFSASNSASAASNILSLETAVQSLRSVNGFGSDNTNLLDFLKTEGSLPTTLAVSGDKVLNEWGGEVAIVVTGGGQGFSIAYNKVPKSIAGTLSLQLLNGGIFSGISINQTTVPYPASSGDIANALKNVTGSNVDLIFLVGPLNNS